MGCFDYVILLVKNVIFSENWDIFSYVWLFEHLIAIGAKIFQVMID